MHDGMQHDLIQRSRSQALQSWKCGHFTSYLRHLQWQLATDHWFWNYGTTSKFDRSGFLGQIFDRVDL